MYLTGFQVGVLLTAIGLVCVGRSMWNLRRGVVRGWRTQDEFHRGRDPALFWGLVIAEAAVGGLMFLFAALEFQNRLG